MAPNARAASLSISIGVWGGHTARRWNKSGHISMGQFLVPARWARVLVTPLSTIIGGDGTGPSLRGLVSQLLSDCAIDSDCITGDSLLKAFLQASKMKQKHRKLERLSTASYPAPVTAEWRALMIAWDEDYRNQDPYKAPESGMFYYAGPT
jgi:hypothetical protein